MDADKARRDLLKAIAAGTGVALSRVLLPSLWATPLISAVALPAHAQASGTAKEVATNPITSVSNAASTGGKIAVTVVIKPPAEVLTTPPLQFELYETFGATTKVVGTFVPTAASTPVSITLIRDPGSYSYQVRWAGGFGAAYPQAVQ